MKSRTITCDQCDVLVINNCICHEHGCPNAWEDEIRECKFCGQKFEPHDQYQHSCCEDCERAYCGYS